MKDVSIDPDKQNPYECFECGKMLSADTFPGNCPECAGEMRNRSTPLE